MGILQGYMNPKLGDTESTHHSTESKGLFKNKQLLADLRVSLGNARPVESDRAWFSEKHLAWLNAPLPPS